MTKNEMEHARKVYNAQVDKMQKLNWRIKETVFVSCEECNQNVFMKDSPTGRGCLKTGKSLGVNIGFIPIPDDCPLKVAECPFKHE